MRITLKSILDHLSSKEIEFSVHGDDIPVTQLAAVVLAPTVHLPGSDNRANMLVARRHFNSIGKVNHRSWRIPRHAS